MRVHIAQARLLRGRGEQSGDPLDLAPGDTNVGITPQSGRITSLARTLGKVRTRKISFDHLIGADHDRGWDG
jgi:hypothetical protein